MNKFLIFVLVVIVAVLAFEFMPSVKRFGGQYGLTDSAVVTDYYYHSVISAGSAATSSHSLVERNVNRQFLEICNLGNATAHIYATSVAAYVKPTGGIILPASTTAPYRNCYKWVSGDNLYLGQVMATSTATTSYLIIER